MQRGTKKVVVCLTDAVVSEECLEAGGEVRTLVCGLNRVLVQND